MKTFDCVQLSPTWYELRRGVPSASNADRLLTPTGKPSAQQASYICELVAELYCLHPGAMTEKPMNAAMRHGVDCEPEARHRYAMETEREARLVGWCTTDDGRFGCSPDGLVGEDGALELKCPQGKTQVAWALDGGLPAEYRPQVHFQLVVTGRQWVDFFSYAPGLPVLLVRVEPDDYTMLMAEAMEAFWEKFQAAKARIGGRP